jgi:flagellar basal-body rod protein FlgC
MDVSGIDISLAGMRAQRLRLEVAALNLANAETTSVRTETAREEGETFVRHVPYRRRAVVFDAAGAPRVVEDPSPFRREHAPSHPHAIAAGRDRGVVEHPNVDPLVEMAEMAAAARAYEANLSAVEVFKAMAASALRILA